MEDFTEIDFIKLVAAGMLLAFILAASIVVFVLVYQRKLSKQQLNMQRMKLEHQEVLIQSGIQISEKERKQFASNLHDVIGAQVAIAKITLSSAEESSAANQAILDKTMDLLDEISSSVRSISYNIMPPVLIKLGLSRAIEDYIEKLPQSDCDISFDSNIENKRFDQNKELHAFRIVQEAITNSMKYAEADHISVELKPANYGLFQLRISDNGKGFEKDEHFGSGLLNMEHRSNLMSYSMDIDSDSSGTRIVIYPNKKVR